ncbi:uncharacterized protein LOC114337737 [Diabrotica virgifera virgifera]|uniref:Ribosomal protein mS38 C-terminal domain-containing protein n=1 Tax=Diabrotica virgifera virgifera TaxID=50390 RepID=A0ABM5IVP1_DIAVI|nr:uncharacterized protein LOC114337737 [Diabrotica virgifera virgifera]
MLLRFLRIPKIKTVAIPIRELSNLSIGKATTAAKFIPVLETSTSTIQNPWIYRQNDNFNLPRCPNLKIDLPNTIKIIIPAIEPNKQDVIEAPAFDDSIKKEAVKMIVIRRKKMKKHKLKKLRKRMKFEWAKKRQRRELKKEKAFQAELIQQCKEAEGFSAEQYVKDKISEFKKASETLSEAEHSTKTETKIIVNK